MIETIATGAAKTPFLKFGDVVRIEMMDGEGHSILVRSSRQWRKTRLCRKKTTPYLVS